MENPITQFQNAMQSLSQLPYPLQEKSCNAMQFIIEDFIKKFPPSSIKVNKLLFSALKEIADFYARDKVVLEIGPGFNVGVMLLAALGGATKAIGVDLFPHDMGPDHDFIVSMFAQVEENPEVPIIEGQPWSKDRLATEFATLIEKDEKGRYAFRKNRLEYLFPYNAEKLPCENDSIDLVFTSAAFEHFRNPEKVVEELSRVTRLGGVSCHSIDQRDHRNFSKPLEYLKLDEKTWQELNSSSPSYIYTNRLRNSQTISLFENYGFTLLGVRLISSIRPDNELRQQFEEPYKSMPDNDLFTLGQIYIFRKDH
jgi:SAM-dependent methyltransferase